jgi:hypothetical protein
MYPNARMNATSSAQAFELQTMKRHDQWGAEAGAKQIYCGIMK